MLNSLAILTVHDCELLNPAIPEQEFLYHYTSLQSMEGILTKREVWASILHFLNDSQEWCYSLNLVRAELEKQRLVAEQSWPDFIDKVTKYLDGCIGLNICVFSMSAMPNQLSQWRGYCPPDGGYALRFRKESLRMQLEAQGFELRPCEYDVKRQLQQVRDLINSVLNGSARTTGQMPLAGMAFEGLVRYIQEKFEQRLIKFAPYLKHHDFEEESEWRAAALVRSDDPRMSYHLRGSVVIPHCKIRLDALAEQFPIDCVIVGPGRHQDLACRGVSSILSASGLRCISICRSPTPLRNV